MLLKNAIAKGWRLAWPPAHRRWEEAEMARLQTERMADARRRTDKLFAERRARNFELRDQEYDAHLRAVDLTGLVERSGRPLKVPEIEDEVRKRKRLAVQVKRDLQLGLPEVEPDKAIEANLDRANQHFLMDHQDPDRQRKTAKAIMDIRADIDPIPSISDYATAVAGLVARERAKSGLGDVATDTVVARAILLRSADPRWTRTLKGALRPLSETPYR